MSFIDDFDSKPLLSAELENDGRLGLPVTLTVLFDKERFTFKRGHGGTPVMIYVIGTAVRRVGTLPDSEIVRGMLDRGYAVTVLDYHGSEAAHGYGLDLSVQGIRQRIMKGEFFASVEGLGKGTYPETLVVPSGCDASYGNVFFEFDKHGADGTLEKIVEIWNNDFRGTKGENIIKWVDNCGNRKATQAGFDGSEPVWLDEDGNESDDGQYIRVKHTLAYDVTDCVKPDGTMIDLKLYMHIVYPTEPKERVPVMCLASSAEGLCSGSATADRPHMNGFVFGGFAGVMYDYPYTPMARLDHYGYFDGYPKAGYVTGDNATYSLKTYNVHADTAAMRFIRYLALSQGEKYRFDIEAIGVYGNSKGGWTTYLGETDPDAMPHTRMFKGHHGETRYENGKTEGREGVHGGEEQPWLTYDGKSIFGGAQLIYSGCGASWYGVTKGHTPLFVSCNRRDESCFSTSNSLVNLGRVYDIPTMWLEIPLPHTLTYGEDLMYGIDSYRAFMDFAGYHLRHDPVKALGVRVNKDRFPVSVTVMLTGGIDKAQAERIKVTDNSGSAVTGAMESEYGGQEWTFTPSVPVYGGGYTLTVPKGIVGSNGKESECEVSFGFDMGDGCVAGLDEADNVARFAKRSVAFEVINDGVNTVSAYNGEGERLGSVNVSGRGWYRIDVTGKNADGVTLKAEKAASRNTVCYPLNLCSRVSGEKCAAPDGTPALRVDGFLLDTSHPTEEFYAYPTLAVKADRLVKDTALDRSDLGRRFKIRFKVYDTVSRYICFGLNHCSRRVDGVADYHRVMGNERTRKCDWTEYTLDYTVYEPLYGANGEQVKSFSVFCFGNGEQDSPIYFADLTCEETVTDVMLGDTLFVGETDERILPLGMSDIVCEKSPWSK